MQTHEEFNKGYRSTNLEGHDYISCGKPALYVDVKICSEDGLPLPERTIGEVWLSSPSVTSGYWEKDPSLLNVATLESRSYLITGDMGFMEHGDLFITGRKKEMFKVRGQNIFPTDIEEAAKSAGRLLQNSVMAAFSVDDGKKEMIMLALEVPHGTRQVDLQKELVKIKSEVFDKSAIEVEEIICLRKGGVPRTSSGKIKRVYCRTLYLTKKFDLFQDDWKNTDWYLSLFKKYRKFKIFWKLKTGF
jgi:acyl-CoA synthetase (AMP-forming)/AMP-acid ligase II